MSIVIDLPPHIESALSHLAEQQGRTTAEVALSRLAATFGDLPVPDESEAVDFQAVAEIGEALAEMDAAAQRGNYGVSVDEAFAELARRKATRRASVAA